MPEPPSLPPQAHAAPWLSPPLPLEAGTVLVRHWGCRLLHQPQTGFKDGPVGQVSRDPRWVGEGEGGWGMLRAGGACCVWGLGSRKDLSESSEGPRVGRRRQTPELSSAPPAGPRGGPSGRREASRCSGCRPAAIAHSVPSGHHFVDTSARIRLPDDCTVGYIVECKLGGRLQPSPLFHSHLETLQLLQAAQLLDQVSGLGAGGTGGGDHVSGYPY